MTTTTPPDKPIAAAIARWAWPLAKRVFAAFAAGFLAVDLLRLIGVWDDGIDSLNLKLQMTLAMTVSYYFTTALLRAVSKR